MSKVSKVLEYVVCFVVKNEKILLVEKTQGFSAGILNGSGGKILPNETKEEAVLRTAKIDAQIVPINAKEIGVVDYKEKGRPLMRVFFFRATEYAPYKHTQCVPSGVNQNSEWAKNPQWYSGREIPLHKMWEGDRYFVPSVFFGTPFKMAQNYDGRKLLSTTIIEVDAVEEKAAKMKRPQRVLSAAERQVQATIERNRRNPQGPQQG